MTKKDITEKSFDHFQNNIVFQGIRTHNLRNIDLTLPKNKIISVTWVSGSWKSSLAFDTIYKEWQFRYIESLSSYLRQFFNLWERPDIDYCHGLSPAIAIEQNKKAGNSRSSVWTLTEIDDYIRLLYAKLWNIYCYGCGKEIKPQTIDQIIELIKETYSWEKVYLLKEIKEIKDKLELNEFVKKNRNRVEKGKWFTRYLLLSKTEGDPIEYFYLEEPNVPNNFFPLNIYGIFDRVTIESNKLPRLKEDIIKILQEVQKFGIYTDLTSSIRWFTDKMYCPDCNIVYPEFTPQHFSGNRQEWACPMCHGIWEVLQVDFEKIIDPESPYLNAIFPRRDSMYWQMILKKLAEKYSMDEVRIWKDLPARFLQVVLEWDWELLRVNTGGKFTSMYYKWIEEIIKEQYIKWLLTVDFQAMIDMRPCPDCKWDKLRKESLNVFLEVDSGKWKVESEGNILVNNNRNSQPSTINSQLNKNESDFKLLWELTDKNLWFKAKKVKLEERLASRWIVFDDDWKVAILYVTKDKYYKIPGWWVEEWEDLEEVLKRELLEEIWVKVLAESKLWYIKQTSTHIWKTQTSYCYMCKVDWKKWKSNLAAKEKADWFKVKWLDIDKAIKLFEKIETDVYHWKFMQTRDLTFLKEAKKILGTSSDVNWPALNNKSESDSSVEQTDLDILTERHNIADLHKMPISELITFLTGYQKNFNKPKILLDRICMPLLDRARTINDLWLWYLSLSRTIDTLSWWEIQRIRLAKQLWNKLNWIVYVLDEPTIWLDEREIKRAIEAIRKLKDMWNTIIVVEHNEEFIKASDRVVEIGPWAWDFGWNLMFNGTYDDFLKTDTLTAQYITWRKQVKIDFEHHPTERFIKIKKASKYNLKSIDVKIRLWSFTIITWPSWAGKTTLMYTTLFKFLNEKEKFIQSYIRLNLLKKWRTRQQIISAPVMNKEAYWDYENMALQEFYKELGVETIMWYDEIKNVIYVDQTSIGKTPRSCPATFIGTFDHIRTIFAGSNEAKYLWFTSWYFSFNSQKWACPACQWYGYKKVELQFLPDTYVPCDLCKWKRYKPEVLDIKWKWKNIVEILEMYVSDALELFKDIGFIKEELQLMCNIWLWYLRMWQPAHTLSWWESQRLKLVKHLLKSYKWHSIYFLDEPTVWLHAQDIEKLLRVIKEFLDKWDTILMIEHDKNLLKYADEVIRLEDGKIV